MLSSSVKVLRWLSSVLVLLMAQHVLCLLECECALGTTLSSGNTGDAWEINDKRDATLCVAAKSCTLESTATKALNGGSEILFAGIPTSDFYQYENESSLHHRLEVAYRQFGNSLVIIRKCTTKSIMHLNDTNFGANNQGQSGLRRVFFYNNDTGV